MIVLENLSLVYKDEVALSSLNLSILSGELVCMLGASGSGKTSILSLVSGVRTPSTGFIRIKGIELNAIREKTVLISQNYGLLPWKTVYDNIAFTLKIRGMINIKDRVEGVLESLGMVAYKDRFPHQLSGGQKQRVAIGRALALDADLLLMDEAFSSLDSLTKETLQNQVLNLNKEQEITTVFVSHNIEEAVFLASRIIILEKGILKKDFLNPAQGTRKDRPYYEMCDKVRGFLHD